MKILKVKILVLFCLSLASMLATADNRFESGGAFRNIAVAQWKLGKFRGENRGYEILFQTQGRNRWQRAPGEAMAIGDGWVLGTDRHNGGYGIYRWNGYDWNRMPGAAVRIGGSYRQPWVENDRGIRYVWNGYDWMQSRNFAGNGGFDRNRNNHDYDRSDRRNNFNERDRRDQRDDRSRDGRAKWNDGRR